MNIQIFHQLFKKQEVSQGKETVKLEASDFTYQPRYDLEFLEYLIKEMEALRNKLIVEKIVANFWARKKLARSFDTLIRDANRIVCEIEWRLKEYE